MVDPELALFCENVTSGGAYDTVGSMTAFHNDGFELGCYERELLRFLDSVAPICRASQPNLEAEIRSAFARTVQTCPRSRP